MRPAGNPSAMRVLHAWTPINPVVPWRHERKHGQHASGGAGSRLANGLPLQEQGIFVILSGKQGACTPTSAETGNFSRPLQKLRASGANFPVIRAIRAFNGDFRDAN